MTQKLNWFQRVILGKQLADTLSRPNVSERLIVVHEQPIGSAGTRNFSGYADEEYLSTLRGMKAADELDKMRRSDPTIIMLLNAVKNLIRSAEYRIEPGDDSEEAKADADLIKHILFEDMGSSFDQFLSEALSMIDFGHSVFEVTHKVVTEHPVFGNYIGIKSLGWRSPRTIDRWNLDPDTGKLKSISQQAWGDLSRLIDIPAEFLLVMTINKEGSNFEGISMLRPCYGSYIRKKTYMKLNAIGIEKFAIPTPIAKIPPNTETTSPQYINLVDSLTGFVGHESQFLIHPEGWDIQLVTNTYDPEKVEKSVDAEERRMINAFGANFLSLGQGSSGGSYALSNDLSDFFTASLDFLVKIIEAEVNRGLICNMIKINRGERDVYPKLCHSGISDKAGKELAESLKAFADGRYIVPDDNTEEHLRKLYKLPKASKEGQRQLQAQQPNPLALPSPKTDVVPKAGVPVEPTVDVQKTVLNGAQVTALVDIVSKVAQGLIPRDAAVNIVIEAFNISKEEAERLVGQAGKGFQPSAVDPQATKLAERGARSLYNLFKLAEQRKVKS